LLFDVYAVSLTGCERRSVYVTGALYDIGFGQKMYLGCNGTGSPTGQCYTVLYMVKNYYC